MSMVQNEQQQNNLAVFTNLVVTFLWVYHGKKKN